MAKSLIKDKQIDSLNTLKLKSDSVTTGQYLRFNGTSWVPANLTTDLGNYALKSIQIIAGNGLTGGGDLSANRTLTLGTPSNITLSSTNSVTTSSHSHAFAPGGTTSQYLRGDGSLATFPTLPTVNDGALSVTDGATSLITFTANQSANTTVDLALSSTYTKQRLYDDGTNRVNTMTADYSSTQRTVLEIPSDVYGGLSLNFKSNSILPGTTGSTWASLLNINTYTDATGYTNAAQLAFTTTGVWHRAATSDSTWATNFKRLAYIDDAPTNYVATDLTTSITVSPIAGQDANTVASASTIYLNGTATNTPNDRGFLYTTPYITTAGYQTFLGQTIDDNYWFRAKTASTWGTWHQIASRDWVINQIPSTPNLQQVTDIGATTTNRIAINYGTVAGGNDILALTQNGGGIGFGNFTSSSGIFTPRLTVTAAGQTSTGLGVSAQGSDTGYTTGALYVSARNAAGTGAVLGGNLVSLRNYTTEKFAVDYLGNMSIYGNANFLQTASVYSNGTQLITHIKQPASLWINNTATTGYIAITHAMISPFQATMFDMKLRIFNYLGTPAPTAEVRLTFYLNSATAQPTGTGVSAYITGTNTTLIQSLLASNAIQVGFNSGGDLVVLLGSSSLSWGSYCQVQVEDITTMFTGGNNVQWQNGWTVSAIGTSLTGYTGLRTIPTSNLNNLQTVSDNGNTTTTAIQFPFVGSSWYNDNTGASRLYIGSAANANGWIFQNSQTTQTTQFRNSGGTIVVSIDNSGTILSHALAGTGTRMVVTDASGNLSAQALPITYTSSTSVILSGTSFQRAALTGDVTATQNSNATTIAVNVVSNTKLADMAANTFKGRLSSTGDPQDLTVSQMKTALGIVDEVSDNGYGFGSATEGFTGWSTLGGFATGMKVITGNYNLDKSDRSILFYGSSAITFTLLDPGGYAGMELFLSFNLSTSLSTAVTFGGSYQPYFYDSTGTNQTTIGTITGTQIKNSFGRYMHIQSDGTKWWWLNSSV